MPYITMADLETRFGADEIIKLADRDGDSIADSAVIAAAIDDAGAVIDSRLAGRYELPLSPVPAIIIRLACAIARYHLYDDKPTEQVEAEYKAALVALEIIAAGEILLMCPDGASSGPQHTQGSEHFKDAKEY